MGYYHGNERICREGSKRDSQEEPIEVYLYWGTNVLVQVVLVVPPGFWPDGTVEESSEYVMIEED